MEQNTWKPLLFFLMLLNYDWLASSFCYKWILSISVRNAEQTFILFQTLYQLNAGIWSGISLTAMFIYSFNAELLYNYILLLYKYNMYVYMCMYSEVCRFSWNLSMLMVENVHCEVINELINHLKCSVNKQNTYPDIWIGGGFAHRT